MSILLTISSYQVFLYRYIKFFYIGIHVFVPFFTYTHIHISVIYFMHEI